MLLRHLTTHGFRNLRPQTIVFPQGLVAVLGANGAGKTSLLEAVAVLGNLVSFRPAAATAWVQRGRDGFSLEAEILRESTPVTIAQRGRLARTLSRQLFRGARRLSPAEYLELFPVAALSAHDTELVWGRPEDRRRFLDRVAFFLHPETLLVAQRYRRALRQRNALLLGGGSDDAFEAFELDMAASGARLVQLRGEGLVALEDALRSELGALGWALASPHLRYHAPDGLTPSEGAGLGARMRAHFARLRRQERARGHTLIGPHRHDLELTVAGAPARETLSAGQGKLLATACKLAAMTVFERSRGRVPMVVFDDIDAELDARVLERIVARLSGAAQALVSSAHDEMMMPRLAGAAIWRMDAGTVLAS